MKGKFQLNLANHNISAKVYIKDKSYLLQTIKILNHEKNPHSIQFHNGVL